MLKNGCQIKRKKEKAWRSKDKKNITKMLHMLQKYFKNISNCIDFFFKM